MFGRFALTESTETKMETWRVRIYGSVTIVRNVPGPRFVNTAGTSATAKIVAVRACVGTGDSATGAACVMVRMSTASIFAEPKSAVCETSWTRNGSGG
jgi:hypothetical protein